MACIMMKSALKSQINTLFFDAGKEKVIDLFNINLNKQDMKDDDLVENTWYNVLLLLLIEVLVSGQCDTCLSDKSVQRMQMGCKFIQGNLDQMTERCTGGVT